MKFKAGQAYDRSSNLIAAFVVGALIVPQIVQCPSCSSKLKVPDDSKKLRCPKCTHVFETAVKSGDTSKPRVQARPVQAGSTPAKMHGAKPQEAKPQGLPPAAKPRPVSQIQPSKSQPSQPQAEKKSVRCPHCQATLKISASALGKKVRCPKCSSAFTTGAAAGQSVTPEVAAVPAFEPFGSDDLFGSSRGDSVPELGSVGLAPASPDLYPPANPAPYGGSYQAYAPPPAPRRKKARRKSDGWQSWLTEPDLLLKLIGVVTLLSFILSAIPLLGIAVFVVVLLAYAVIQVIGGLWLILIAFEEDAVQGIMYLFVPFYALIYLVTRWEACRVPFMMCMVSLASLIASGCGMFVGMAIIASLSRM